MLTFERFRVVLGTAILIGSAAACGGSGGNGSAAKPAATAAPPPDGATALRQSMQAFQAVKLFTLVQTTTTELGVFTMTTEVDCAAPYYRYLRTVALTQKGIDNNSTQLQGRARAKTEEEKLFVDGRSFDRFSGTWESAPANVDDARPNWGPSRSSHDPSAECVAFGEGKAPGLPFDKMQAATKVDYRGQRTVDGAQCHEFVVTFKDQVLGEMSKPVDSGDGFKSSVRQQVTKPVEATVCLGVTDSLPYQGASGDKTVEFRYKPFQKLAVP